MFASTVLGYDCTEGNLNLLEADSDLLIMLIYFPNSIIGEITVQSEAKKKHKAIECDISNIKTA